jgi:hypothetical protein
MSAEPREVSGLQVAINRAALSLSLAILAAIGVVWWRDRTRTFETPRWDAGRFVTLHAPAGAPRTTWMLIVNPSCTHCRARLADLLRRPRDPERHPALGVLLVDLAHRPDTLEATPRIEGGVYWDSLAVWRRRWGHRVYGEVLVFAPGGALERSVGPESDPESTAAH